MFRFSKVQFSINIIMAQIQLSLFGVSPAMASVLNEHFLTRSPRIEKVEVERHSRVRRAKLYFLRKRTGKSARLKQKFN